jgi:hypothetical protein
VSTKCVLKEPPCSLSIAFGRDLDVDDLAKLVDRAVDLAPLASDLDVGLVGEPAVPDREAGRARRIGQQWCESLHPAVDRDVTSLIHDRQSYQPRRSPNATKPLREVGIPRRCTA